MSHKRKAGSKRRRYSNATVSRTRPSTSFQQRNVKWCGYYVIDTIASATGQLFIKVDPDGCLDFPIRFGNAWNSFRMIGAELDVNIVIKEPANTAPLLGLETSVALMQFANAPTFTFVPPTSEAQMQEIPQTKWISNNSANPKNSRHYSWRTKDINSLPFQNILNTNPQILDLVAIVGFSQYVKDSGADANVVVRGKIQVEFRDEKIYVPAPDYDFENVSIMSPKPIVKRLTTQRK